jgi:hypothetical protein
MTEKCYNHGCAIFTRPLRKRHTRRGAADEESAAADTSHFARDYAALGWKARSGLFLKRGETMMSRKTKGSVAGCAPELWNPLGYFNSTGRCRRAQFYHKLP